jgi:hypothetical protein
MATFARSETDCWRPSAGRITGKTALEGTFLQQQFKYAYEYVREASCSNKIRYHCQSFRFSFSSI